MKVSGPRGRLVVPGILACWSLGALAFTVLPVGSNARVAVSVLLSWVAVGFAAAVMWRASVSSAGNARAFWRLMASGMVACLVADTTWVLDQVFRPESGVLMTFSDAAYVVSYALLFVALLRLLSLTMPQLTLVCALDSGAIALSLGMLAWFFVLEPGTADFEGWRDVAASLFLLVCDAALLFVCLVVLSSANRPRAIGLLLSSFVVFLAADLIYLGMRSSGPYEVGNWPEMAWSLGAVLLGLAALRTPEMPGQAPRDEWIEPWRVLSFWLGPLSPALQFGVMLLWGAFRPPLPAYVPIGAAALLFYLAVRVALIAYVRRHLDRERQATTRKLEQARLLYDMRDAVEGGLGSITVSVLAAIEADRRGDHEGVRELLYEALQTTREAEVEISRPYDELAAAESTPAPGAFLRHRAERFEEYFGIKTHVDFRVPLESLSPPELAAANRVAVEAFWNVTKHARARNIYLESRRVGNVFVFRIRDDGRGFDAADPPPGMGLTYLRQRAREAGGRLDVISSPGSGTTVQIRFEHRGGSPEGPRA
jgi:signal transduction histidine kinase